MLLSCEIGIVLYIERNKKKESSLDNSLLVGVTGIEPATSWSQTTRAPSCATPRGQDLLYKKNA